MWKRVLFYGLLVGGLWLFITNLAQIKDVFLIVLASRWHWVLLGVLCQLGYFLGYAFLYQNTFRLVGIEAHWRQLFPLTFTTLFVTLLAPFGGAGLALYVDDAKQHEKSGFKTAMGVLLGTFIFLLTFSSVLAVGLYVLHREGELQAHELFTSSVVFIIVVVSILLLWVGAKHPLLLHNIFNGIYNLYNPLMERIRPKWQLKETWVADRQNTVRTLGTKVVENPLSLTRGISIAFILHALHMASLFCVVMALRQTLTIGMLITSYSITMLLVMISVVPQGVGLVEGVLTLLLRSFGIALEPALAIVAVYRTISFGIPAVIGFFLLRRLKTFRKT